ncbi:MAG: sulfotransferase domain-containing protein [Gemmatimonadales bacterium]
MSDSRHQAQFREGYEIVMQNRLLMHQQSVTFSERLARLKRRVRYQFLSHYFSRPPRWRLYLRRFGGERVYPNFASVGPLKSGTSDLANYLFQHPSILPPLAKEIPSAKSADWLPYYPTRAEFDAVARAQGTALTGFFYPWLHKVALIDELGSVAPQAKIILLLRDPVERAYSHYKWDLFLGGPGLRQMAYFATFLDNVRTAVELFPAITMPSACGHPMLASGIYHRAVELWMRKFGRENVLIVTSEEFFRDPGKVVAACLDFLGVPPITVEPVEVVNPNPMAAPPFDPESRRLLTEFYRPFNQQLYVLINRDLGW